MKKFIPKNIEIENADYLSIIEKVIEDNPMQYTMMDSETKECFVEEMEKLTDCHTLDDLEDYVIENLQTDSQILSSQYNKSSEELEFLESACANLGIDYEDALKKGL